MTDLLRRPLPGKGVYAITDGPRDDLFAAVEATLAGGARLLQYRDKTTDSTRRREEADALSGLCAQHGATFIVNDDVALAAETGGGVHLGREDVSIAQARAALGAEAIIGVSCYGSIERARQLRDDGADYLAFGAMYPSPTKPHAPVTPHGVLTQAKALGLPIVAIGGITVDNAGVLIEAGADYLAVVSAIFAAADIQTATRGFADLFESRSGMLR